MKGYKFYFIIFSCLIGKIASASTGCIADVPFQTNGRLYITLNGGIYNAYGSGYDYPNTTFCVIGTGNSCNVQGVFTYTGYEVTYGSLPCPLDGSILFDICILIGSSMLGFLFLNAFCQYRLNRES